MLGFQVCTLVVAVTAVAVRFLVPARHKRIHQYIFNEMSVTRCARLLSSSKNAALLLSQRTIQIHGDLSTARLLPMVPTMHSLVPKGVHTISEQRTSASVERILPKTGYVERMLRKWGILDVQKYRNMYLGYFVYEHVMKQVDYAFFFKHFNMADTFFSWFLVTELHVWMIMVRYMADEKDGKDVRKYAVSAMWDDTKARVENLGTIKSKLKNQQIEEISHQFNAAIIGYDEGIQSDDKTLAGALWRRFFQSECNNPEHVETLVLYVRKQICLFDSLPNHEVLKKPILKLIDIKSLCKHRQ
ncbi:ubiquinol-cytochrome-c reductase complex assembly factor 1 isoform X2 [Solenopsis invicta]|uniref:ubiquinol-cytochrome-c reductase complex assembly factor 1 isoform X2 n=1 Tax=Solenopsis invicta TaxID=13686 RepID=UPI00193D3B8A|nr:ubiquinol-cytochrome-c reductase complex assembly factor 1 isoform X2 [Solenopsis invicta]